MQISSSTFEETIETHSGDKSHPVTSSLDSLDSLRMHFKRRKSHTNAASATLYPPRNLRTHFKTHSANATCVIKHIFRQAIWERIWKFTVQMLMQMQPMWFYTYQGRRFKESFENTTTPHCCKKPFQHILIVICVVNTRFLTTLWENTYNSTVTQRRETVSTYYNCDWRGKLHDFWQRFGTHCRETGSTYLNCNWCVKNTIPDSVLGSHWIPISKITLFPN